MSVFYPPVLADPSREKRLEGLRVLKNDPQYRRGEAVEREMGRDVNNHIHTTYSFSPYTPTAAIWMAYQAGLSTAGIMDHDSICGAREFLEAGAVMGIPATCGVECRVSFDDTPLRGRRFNNPDQDGIAYTALHAIPHNKFDTVRDYFAPFMAHRATRNRAMIERINALLRPYGLVVDYDRDVLPLSMAADGGAVTERHLLYAVTLKIVEKYGRGTAVCDFLSGEMGIALSDKARAMLSDPQNIYYDYDLLGVLKSDMVEKFYIDATDECPPVREVAKFCREHGIIYAYAYLGDVIGESVTGDKKAQTFEDPYLDELFEVLVDCGYVALTYIPSRNTPAQVQRIHELCQKHNLFEISGEDINQPRQAFVSKAMREERFAGLTDAAWALIGHEQLATREPSQGMFSPETIAKMPELQARIAHYRDTAREIFSK